MEGVVGEIFVVTGPGQGHLHPCMELCTHLSSHNFHTTFVIPSISGTTTTQIPSSFSQNPLTSFVYITFGPPCAPDPIRPASNPPLNSKPISPPTAFTPNLRSSAPSSTSKSSGQKRSSKNSTSLSSTSSPSARAPPPWSWAHGKPKPVSSTQARRPDSFLGYLKKWPLCPPILNENL